MLDLTMLDIVVTRIGSFALCIVYEITNNALF